MFARKVSSSGFVNCCTREKHYIESILTGPSRRYCRRRSPKLRALRTTPSGRACAAPSRTTRPASAAALPAHPLADMSIVGMGVSPHFASPHAPTIAARLTHMDAKFASLVVTINPLSLLPFTSSSDVGRPRAPFLFISAAFVV